MAQLVMPKMGDGMEEGTIRRWLKSEGDTVAEQEIVAEIETEKAAIEIPATEAGTLRKILVAEGTTVAVGTPIAEVGNAGDASSAGPASNGQAEEAPAHPQQAEGRKGPGAEAPAPAAPDADLGHRDASPAGGAQAAAAAPVASAGGGRVKASPLARKVAQEHGVDLAGVQGTGPGGRIIEADVEEALRQRPAAQPAAQPAATAQPAPAAASVAGTDRPMSQIRKVIARRLTESKQTIPHFYVTIDVDMRAAWQLRKQFNDSVDEDRKVSFNDLVIRACVLALEKYPALNSRLEGESIRTPASINIGVAVSLEDGLIVPVVKDAQTKSISAVGREVRALAEKARRGQLAPNDYSGGTFTISNLGMYDIVEFQAIINAPEAAILAVGAIRDTPIVENGQVIPGKQMYLTASVDHRLVDGQVAAQFMQEVKRLLQGPMGLLG